MDLAEKHSTNLKEGSNLSKANITFIKNTIKENREQIMKKIKTKPRISDPEIDLK